MKSILKNIIIAILLFITASCNNDFLNENLDPSTVPVGESTIYISPEWESADYQFHLPNMGNADFKIESTPSWLHINTMTGSLVNSIATIHCSVSKISAFDKIGVYVDKMKVSVNKQSFYISVAYLTEGNPTIQVEKTISFNAVDSYDVQIYNSGEGLLIWDVISLPNWLSIDMDRFNYINPTGVVIPQHSHSYLPLNFNLKEFPEKDLKGSIILKTNDRNNPTVEIEAVLNLGNPEIGIWLNNNSLNFGATETSYSLDIYALGTGFLSWRFEELPKWLTVTPSKGVYRTHTFYDDVIFTCDRSKLQPGINSAVIYLKSNAYNKPSIAITVTARAPGDNTNIRDLGENIIDVAFDKNTNTLYYATSMLNKLIAYDVSNRSVLYELQLNKIPTCFAISEDYTKAAVGHGGQISFINLENKSIKKVEVNGTVYDIAWGTDDWFCYTITDYSKLCWINFSNSTTYESPNNHLYSNDIIKKLPGHPYIIATRNYVSPSGFIVYSTSTKDLKSYSHMNLSNFWFSQDGQYIFGVSGSTYRTSNVIDSDDTLDAPFYSIGQLKGAPNNDYVKWIDHSSRARAIWVINYYQSIYQYDDNDYTYQKTYFYSDIYQPEGQSFYEVEAQYIFSNKEDSELSVLRKGKDNNKWSIEFIEVTP